MRISDWSSDVCSSDLIAVYDLWAQLYDAPLYKMLGGGEPVITTDITISVDHIDKMVADSLSAVDRGFESLKIKVGKDIGVDIERVRAIYAAVEGRALLRRAANQGWTAKQDDRKRGGEGKGGEK